MIGSKHLNKPKRTLSRDATLKPLTDWFGFVGIITLPIKAKYDCEQSRFYLKTVREKGVLQTNFIQRQAFSSNIATSCCHTQSKNAPKREVKTFH